MPRAPRQRFGHRPATAWARTSTATVASRKVFVNARPRAASTTSDSGPPGTGMDPVRASAGDGPTSSRNVSIASRSGSVTHTSPTGSTQRT